MREVNATMESYFGEPSFKIWDSDEYFVTSYLDQGTLRMDIKRQDENDGITWDQLQKIKNDCGYEDCDAVEFYPAKKDVINTGNWRHLYVFSHRIPLVRKKYNEVLA
jgi:hypothetical protein